MTTAASRNATRAAAASLRRRFRANEWWFILLSVFIGTCAGLTTVLLGAVARTIQHWAFNLPPGWHLSAMPVLSAAQLMILPIGGLLLGVFSLATRARHRPMVDAVEANALHGGRMSLPDSMVIAGQTAISNGFGGSVGLEAGFAQLGSGIASAIGHWLWLRRGDLRILVGAGAGAAIGAAFGAPLTGAFYAFEIVIGAYTPSSIAPVTAAALSATLVARALGAPSYQIIVSSSGDIHGVDFLRYAVLSTFCALVAIALMRLVGGLEGLTRRITRVPLWLRPMLGGLLLVPIAWVSPQVLSSGHGALHLDLIIGASLATLTAILLLKCAASVISLGFGYRGGLFFASLFIGSLLGHIFTLTISMFTGQPPVDAGNAALVGMAAFAVAVVGGPMTMSMLVLETTHDFALTGAAVAAALVASTIVRDRFGYSFSTWRLHLRGETIKSARDVGWTRSLTAGRMMRRDVRRAPASLTLRAFRHDFPLGDTSRVILIDEDGHYAGIVNPVAVHASAADEEMPVSTMTTRRDTVLTPEMNVVAIMEMFDQAEADELAVIDDNDDVIGVLTESYVRRRYSEELDRSQRDLFGES